MDPRQNCSHIFSILLFLILTVGPAEGFYSQVLQAFSVDNRECSTGWSGWSHCLSTETKNIVQSLPASCRSTTLGMMLRRARAIVNPILKYYRHVNITNRPCGMCLKQIMCSDQCTQTLSNAAGMGKPFGIKERFCPEVDQSYACAVDEALSYDPTSKTCNAWPPKHEYLPAFTPQPVRTMLNNLKLLNCISVSGRCYCCCTPYKPDPCTAKCVITPCSTHVALLDTDYNRING
uniref:Uncharacterized protein n=1 Tax=Trichuris muris TaxID=70415 RepID=A0A5S6QUJ8_TRIMR